MQTNPFRLLDLPGELRNLVYELALSSDKGLVYNQGVFKEITGDTTKGVLADEHHPEFNQLQHVNRQVRQETRFPELAYNTIYIEKLEESRYGLVPSSLGFSNAVPRNKHAQIRSLHFYSGPPAEPVIGDGIKEGVDALIGTMEQVKDLNLPLTPIAEVRYTLPLLSDNFDFFLGMDDHFKASLFVGMAEFVAVLLYGRKIPGDNDQHIRHLITPWERRRQEKAIQKLVDQLPNFWVFPVSSNVDDFRKIWTTASVAACFPLWLERLLKTAFER